MKNHNWKQQLIQDTELRLPERRRPKNETYLPPAAAGVPSGGFKRKMMVKYGLSAAAAIVALLIGAGMFLRYAGPDKQPMVGEGDVSITQTAESPIFTKPDGATVPTMYGETKAPATGTEEPGATDPAAAPTQPLYSTISELSLELAYNSEEIEGEFASYAQMEDGGYVVSGNTMGYADKRTTGNSEKSAMVVRYDAGGRVVYVRLFGGDGWDTFYKVIATRDGGYLACGNTSSRSGGDFDRLGIQGAEGGSVIFVKFNADGNTLWARSGASVKAHNITGYGADSLYETGDGRLIGMVESYDTTSISYYRFCWDAEGNPLTENEYEPVSFPCDFTGDVHINEDGSIIAAGTKESQNGYTGVFFRINSDGSTAFVNEYPSLYFNDGMLLLDDGQYLVIGQTPRSASTADLERAGVIPPDYYKPQKDKGIVFMKLTAEGELTGGDMLVLSGDSSPARYIVPLTGGEALVDANSRGFIDPFTGKTPKGRVCLYRIGRDGKFSRLHTSSSELLTGVYNGLDGLIPQKDGSIQVVCLNNSTPCSIRVLRLKSWE